ncbi:MAG: DUF4397 domain-containing protein [Myxococcota bacterium]|nr:DUF4397 domain-containing protein [Myxococcota bacterium]
MRHIHHHRAARAFAAVVVLSLTACVADDGPRTGEFAAFGAVHLAPDAPALALYLDDEAQPLVTDLGFTDGTSYAALEAGTYDIALAPADADRSEAVLEVEGLSLSDATFYTLVAYGTVDPDDAFPLESLVLAEERAIERSEIAQVRAVHVAPGIGELEVLAVPLDGVAVPIATDLAYGEVADSVELGSAASYVFEVVRESDGQPERLTLGVGTDTSSIVVFVTVDFEGEPLLIGQFDDGSTFASRPVVQQAR